MSDLVGSDLFRGQEIKWYSGGDVVTETITITAGMVTAGGSALAGTAEYGLVVGTVDGVATAIVNFKTDKNTAATESSGCDFVGYAGITEGDVLVVTYVKTSVTALTHIASCGNVKGGAKADVQSETIHGQATKVSAVGAAECSADLERLVYDQAFIAANLGDQLSGSPTTGKETWTNKFQGFKKIGVLVGKKINSSGTVLYKWALCGAQATELSKDFSKDGFYKDSFKYNCDFMIEVDLS